MQACSSGGAATSAALVGDTAAPLSSRRQSLDKLESGNAATLVNQLFDKLLPEWSKLKSGIEIDQAIQKFASEFCKSKWLVGLERSSRGL